jgi:hypothetical protein
VIFINDTPFSAELLSTVIDETRMMASVVARVTYALPEMQPSGVAAVPPIASEQPWPVSRAPWDSPQGRMEQDQPFMKEGVDLFLFGQARAPNGVPVSQMAVRFDVGTFTRQANVIGERAWIRDGRNFVPTRPIPFLEMPLTLRHAFGGKSVWDGLEVPYPENPEGLGFCIEEAQVEGKQLPNLEEPSSPMNAWNDRPKICGFGFCPMANADRFRNGTVLNDAYEIVEFRPQIFNAAYPPMIAPDARPGDVVRIEGVVHTGSLQFALPAPPFGIRLEFGSKVFERVPSVDQVGVEVDARRAFITYRFPFRYTVRPRELRQASLVTREA